MKQWLTKHTPLALSILVVLVGFVASSRIGPSWDEPDNIFSGGVYWNFFRSGFDPKFFNIPNKNASIFGAYIYPLDRNLAHLPSVHNYVGTAFAIAAERLGAPQTSRTVIVAYHWAAALFFALLVAMTYRFGLLLGLSERGSLMAACMTFLYPALFGHGFSNLKDTAQAAMVIVSLYYVVHEKFFLAALLWGIALATKFNAIYVPIIWGLWLLATYSVKKFFTQYTGRFVVFIVIGLFVGFLAWPYLWFDPLGHIRDVFVYFTNANDIFHGFRFYWQGVMYQVGAGNIFWWYPWANLFLETPLTILALAIIGITVVIANWIRGKKKQALLLIWLVIPTLRAFLPGAILYDQLRHFLEILPAFILLAAIGLDAVGTLKRVGSFTVIAISALALGQLLFLAIVYFPYSTGYYNMFAQEANTRFDRDIEALSIKESMDYLHKTYGHVTVWAPIGGHLAWYFIEPGDLYTYTKESADFIILINKSSHIRQAEFEKTLRPWFVLDHTIERGDGSVFAWIYRRK